MTQRHLAVLLAAGAAATLLAGCGSGGSGGSGGSASTSVTGTSAPRSVAASPVAGGTTDGAACDVTDPSTVTAVFGGTSAPEKAGQARNCEYTLTGGRAPVQVVDISSTKDYLPELTTLARSIIG